MIISLLQVGFHGACACQFKGKANLKAAISTGAGDRASASYSGSL